MTYVSLNDSPTSVLRNEVYLKVPALKEKRLNRMQLIQVLRDRGVFAIEIVDPTYSKTKVDSNLKSDDITSKIRIASSDYISSEPSPLSHYPNPESTTDNNLLSTVNPPLNALSYNSILGEQFPPSSASLSRLNEMYADHISNDAKFTDIMAQNVDILNKLYIGPDKVDVMHVFEAFNTIKNEFISQIESMQNEIHDLKNYIEFNPITLHLYNTIPWDFTDKIYYVDPDTNSLSQVDFTIDNIKSMVKLEDSTVNIDLEFRIQSLPVTDGVRNIKTLKIKLPHKVDTRRFYTPGKLILYYDFNGTSFNYHSSISSCFIDADNPDYLLLSSYLFQHEGLQNDGNLFEIDIKLRYFADLSDYNVLAPTRYSYLYNETLSLEYFKPTQKTYIRSLESGNMTYSKLEEKIELFTEFKIRFNILYDSSYIALKLPVEADFDNAHNMNIVGYGMIVYGSTIDNKTTNFNTFTPIVYIPSLDNNYLYITSKLFQNPSEDLVFTISTHVVYFQSETNLIKNVSFTPSTYLTPGNNLAIEWEMTYPTNFWDFYNINIYVGNSLVYKLNNTSLDGIGLNWKVKITDFNTNRYSIYIEEDRIFINENFLDDLYLMGGIVYEFDQSHYSNYNHPICIYTDTNNTSYDIGIEYFVEDVQVTKEEYITKLNDKIYESKRKYFRWHIPERPTYIFLHYYSELYNEHYGNIYINPVELYIPTIYTDAYYYEYANTVNYTFNLYTNNTYTFIQSDNIKPIQFTSSNVAYYKDDILVTFTEYANIHSIGTEYKVELDIKDESQIDYYHSDMLGSGGSIFTKSKNLNDIKYNEGNVTFSIDYEKKYTSTYAGPIFDILKPDHMDVVFTNTFSTIEVYYGNLNDTTDMPHTVSLKVSNANAYTVFNQIIETSFTRNDSNTLYLTNLQENMNYDFEFIFKDASNRQSIFHKSSNTLDYQDLYFYNFNVDDQIENEIYCNTSFRFNSNIEYVFVATDYLITNTNDFKSISKTHLQIDNDTDITLYANIDTYYKDILDSTTVANIDIGQSYYIYLYYEPSTTSLSANVQMRQVNTNGIKSIVFNTDSGSNFVNKYYNINANIITYCEYENINLALQDPNIFVDANMISNYDVKNTKSIQVSNIDTNEQGNISIETKYKNHTLSIYNSNIIYDSKPASNIDISILNVSQKEIDISLSNLKDETIINHSIEVYLNQVLQSVINNFNIYSPPYAISFTDLEPSTNYTIQCKTIDELSQTNVFESYVKTDYYRNPVFTLRNVNESNEQDVSFDANVISLGATQNDITFNSNILCLPYFDSTVSADFINNNREQNISNIFGDFTVNIAHANILDTSEVFTARFDPYYLYSYTEAVQYSTFDSNIIPFTINGPYKLHYGGFSYIDKLNQPINFTIESFHSISNINDYAFSTNLGGTFTVIDFVGSNIEIELSNVQQEGQLKIYTVYRNFSYIHEFIGPSYDFEPPTDISMKVIDLQPLSANLEFSNIIDSTDINSNITITIANNVYEIKNYNTNSKPFYINVSDNIDNDNTLYDVYIHIVDTLGHETNLTKSFTTLNTKPHVFDISYNQATRILTANIEPYHTKLTLYYTIFDDYNETLNNSTLLDYYINGSSNTLKSHNEIFTANIGEQFIDTVDIINDLVYSSNYPINAHYGNVFFNATYIIYYYVKDENNDLSDLGNVSINVSDNNEVYDLKLNKYSKQYISNNDKLYLYWNSLAKILDTSQIDIQIYVENNPIVHTGKLTNDDDYGLSWIYNVDNLTHINMEGNVSANIKYLHSDIKDTSNVIIDNSGLISVNIDYSNGNVILYDMKANTDTPYDITISLKSTVSSLEVVKKEYDVNRHSGNIEVYVEDELDKDNIEHTVSIQVISASNVSSNFIGANIVSTDTSPKFDILQYSLPYASDYINLSGTLYTDKPTTVYLSVFESEQIGITSTDIKNIATSANTKYEFTERNNIWTNVIYYAYPNISSFTPNTISYLNTYYLYYFSSDSRHTTSITSLVVSANDLLNLADFTVYEDSTISTTLNISANLPDYFSNDVKLRYRIFDTIQDNTSINFDNTPHYQENIDVYLDANNELIFTPSLSLIEIGKTYHFDYYNDNSIDENGGFVLTSNATYNTNDIIYTIDTPGHSYLYANIDTPSKIFAHIPHLIRAGNIVNNGEEGIPVKTSEFYLYEETITSFNKLHQSSIHQNIPGNTYYIYFKIIDDTRESNVYTETVTINKLLSFDTESTQFLTIGDILIYHANMTYSIESIDDFQIESSNNLQFNKNFNDRQLTISANVLNSTYEGNVTTTLKYKEQSLTDTYNLINIYPSTLQSNIQDVDYKSVSLTYSNLESNTSIPHYIQVLIKDNDNITILQENIESSATKHNLIEEKIYSVTSLQPNNTYDLDVLIIPYVGPTTKITYNFETQSKPPLEFADIGAFENDDGFLQIQGNLTRNDESNVKLYTYYTLNEFETPTQANILNNYNILNNILTGDFNLFVVETNIVGNTEPYHIYNLLQYQSNEYSNISKLQTTINGIKNISLFSTDIYYTLNSNIEFQIELYNNSSSTLIDSNLTITDVYGNQENVNREFFSSVSSKAINAYFILDSNTENQITCMAKYKNQPEVFFTDYNLIYDYQIGNIETLFIDDITSISANLTIGNLVDNTIIDHKVNIYLNSNVYLSDILLKRNEPNKSFD